MYLPQFRVIQRHFLYTPGIRKPDTWLPDDENFLMLCSAIPAHQNNVMIRLCRLTGENQ